MAGPCWEHQVFKDEPHFDPRAEGAYWNKGRLVIGPDAVKAFYNMAKSKFDKGMDFPQTVDALHKWSGLHKNTIYKILSASKEAKKMTDQMWYEQSKYRSIKSAAYIMAERANTPAWRQKAGDLWDLSRRSATAFHGGVIPFTHARNLALGTPQEEAIWGKMVGRAYAYMTPRAGAARWAHDMETMTDDPKFWEAIRYGVEAKPGDRPVGILSNVTQGWGIRGFDALKPGRVELFHLWKDYLQEGSRSYLIPKSVREALGIKGLNPKELAEGDLRMLAREVNYATGAMHMKASVASSLGAASFAPKVWTTRRLEAFAPIRYFAKLGRMNENQRAIANLTLARWAHHMVMAYGLLQANNAFNKYVLKNDQRVNFWDISKPGTLWRMNVGGYIIPFSPMIEVLRAPVVALGALLNTRRELKGQEPVSKAAEILTREFLNALHPSIVDTLEAITGREMFGVPLHHRRLPFKGVAQLVRGEDPKERDPAIGWPEWIGEKLMIPVASASREIFTPALEEEGIPKPTGEKILGSLIMSALSGGTGMHAFQVSPYATPQRTRYKTPMVLTPPRQHQLR